MHVGIRTDLSIICLVSSITSLLFTCLDKPDFLLHSGIQCRKLIVKVGSFLRAAFLALIFPSLQINLVVVVAGGWVSSQTTVKQQQGSDGWNKQNLSHRTQMQWIGVPVWFCHCLERGWKLVSFILLFMSFLVWLESGICRRDEIVSGLGISDADGDKFLCSSKNQHKIM